MKYRKEPEPRKKGHKALCLNPAPARTAVRLGRLGSCSEGGNITARSLALLFEF